MENSLAVPVSATSSPSLAFLYDTRQQKIIFINQSPAVFFKAPVEIQSSFPFLDLIDEKDKSTMIIEWEKCFALTGHQQHDFSMNMKNGWSPVVFQVQASSTGPSAHILFTINKLPAFAGAGIYKEEYDEFIDIAAHDLDAPLRKLNVLVERLTAKYSQEDHDEIRSYVQRINTLVSNMRSLIDELSVLSKVSTLSPVIDSCDMGMIVKETLHELHPVISEKKAVINYGDLPVLQGDRNQYHRLFRVLLDNALLFTKENTAPHITIRAEEITTAEKKEYGLPGHITYFKIEIADKGIGFSPEMAGKIFRPFVRLHPKSAYPGNGIGLAIAKRVVINHGGIIYVYSAENAGARFIFILPQTIEQYAQFP